MKKSQINSQMEQVSEFSGNQPFVVYHCLFSLAKGTKTYYHLHDLDINDYDPVARTIPEVKHVKIEAKLLRKVLSQENTN